MTASKCNSTLLTAVELVLAGATVSSHNSKLVNSGVDDLKDILRDSLLRAAEFPAPVIYLSTFIKVFHIQCVRLHHL